MVTLIVFILILWLLVVIHELGHFYTAKKSGIFVEEFGLGLPPRAWGIRIGETIYSLNWLPFGGFVRLYGEDAEHDQEYEVNGKKIPKSRAFYKQKPWKKLVVIVAGVVMNFILGVFIFTLVFSIEGIPQVTDRIQILEVVKDSPADLGGVKPGDVVKCLGLSDGECRPVEEISTFVSFLENHRGKQVTVEVIRDEKVESLIVVPRVSPPEGQGVTGIVVGAEVIQKFYPWWEMPIRSAVEGIKEATFWGITILKMLGELVMKLVNGNVPNDVAGPVGIYTITGQVVQYGFMAVLRFVGILSINLAVMNILPLPALDGGRLWFVVYEMVTGKRANMKVERWVNSAGMIVLLSLIALVTILDVTRLFGGKGMM